MLIRNFLVLMGGHFVADYPLQGDFLARGKSRKAPLPGVPWYHAMLAHAGIHGLAVGLVTKSPALGVAETLAHFLIDDLKCSGRLTYNQDQALHIACKILWAALSRNPQRAPKTPLG